MYMSKTCNVNKSKISNHALSQRNLYLYMFGLEIRKKFSWYAKNPLNVEHSQNVPVVSICTFGPGRLFSESSISFG